MYLDFGGALAAIGLVFAVYQLRRPTWIVVLQIRPFWQRYLFLILSLVGAALTVIAVALDRFQPCWHPAWLFASFPYQVLAYLSFVAAPVSLLLLASNRRGLFNTLNAARFYHTLGWHLAATDERAAALDVLLYNFTTVAEAAASLNATEARRYARAVLDVILTDDGVVRELATKRLAGLQHIFLVTERLGFSTGYTPANVPALMRSLYADPNSFLYKQYRAGGLAHALNIYETIFGSPRLLENFGFFDYPALDYTMRVTMASQGIDIFIEALTRAIRTYLTSGEVSAGRINRGLRYLSEVLGDLCYRIAKEAQKGDSEARMSAWDAVHKIVSLLGRDCIFIANPSEWHPTIVESEAKADNEGFNSHLSIAAGFAQAACDALTQLATVEKTVDIQRSYITVVELLGGLTDRDTSSLCLNYRRPFTHKTWERIHENVVHRFYPATSRSYLEYMGFSLICAGGAQNEWTEGQKERVRRLLYIDLSPRFDRNETMINNKLMEEALLPEVMRYEGGRFYYRARYGEGEEVEIARPPPSL